MATSSKSGISMKILILAIGVFFIASGLLGLIDSSSVSNGVGRALGNIFGSGSTKAMITITAVLQLVIGVFLVLDLFNLLKFNGMNIVRLLIFIIWAVFMVMEHIASGYGFNFLEWLKLFSKDLIILASLWIIAKD